MSDLIDREALKAAHGLGTDCATCKRDTRSCQYDRDFSMMDFCEWIDDAPTIDAVPVVHGYWMTKTVRGDYVPCCSECGCGNGTLYEYDYCPNCGARMDKPEPPKEDEHGN